jgi:hypothetical protein
VISPAHDRILGKTFPGEPHCVYCGLSLYRGRTCGGCSDLPALDDDYTAFQMRAWWLERYSLDEIRELAAAVA